MIGTLRVSARARAMAPPITVAIARSRLCAIAAVASQAALALNTSECS